VPFFHAGGLSEGFQLNIIDRGARRRVRLLAMKTKPLLVQLRARVFPRWRALPILGPILDDFLQWLADKGYARGTIANYLKTVPKVIGWLRRHRITALDQLTQQQLRLAHDYYRPKQQDPSWVIGALERQWGQTLTFDN
jgi:hypothetical protein